jgi:hypothetical protein
VERTPRHRASSERKRIYGQPLGGCDVPPSAQEKIHGAARFIYGAIQVDPLAFDLEVSLIHAPRVADRPAYRPQRFSNSGTYCCTHRRIVVWDRVMPRSAIIWTRSRELSLKVRYHRTQSTMISWSKCRPLKSSCAEVGSVIAGR